MSSKGQMTLKNFFIFNPEYGPKEGQEHLKIMYYHPKTTDIDTKIKQVGLCEAITKFTETFSDMPTEALHTQKTRQVFFEPEKNFWMIMTVTVPFSEKTKDNQTIMEYHEEDVQDPVIQAVLRQSYRMFTLFNGSMYHVLDKVGDDVSALQQRLDHFFSRYLLTLKLPNCDILDTFSGISFLPLDKNTYLQVQCFINLLESSFPAVKYTAFLYNDQLVWSGLEQEDMRIMYKYLTTSLFPSYQDQEFQPGSGSGQTASMIRHPSSQSSSSMHYGKFVTGPPSMSDENNMGKVPRVYINTEEDNEECFLLVYRALSASICLLLKTSTTLNFELCRKLDSFLGPRLSTLASEIGEQYSKRPQSGSEPMFKYIYFNHMNLAQKTTVHVDNKRSPNLYITHETLRLLTDISNDLKRSNQDGETIVRTVSDCWVVGKKSDQREVFIVINQKNSNLIEVNEEVKRLCSMNFNSIFFQD